MKFMVEGQPLICQNVIYHFRGKESKMPKKAVKAGFPLKQPDLKSPGGHVTSPKSTPLGTFRRPAPFVGPDLSGGGWVKGGKK